jgi:hypothetical protein
MEVNLEIPEDVAASLGSSGVALSRTVLEALAVEAYRSGTLTTKQVRLMLGHASRFETEDFLSAHVAWPDLSAAEAAEDSRKLTELLRR